jgi:hypothetical protein
MTRKAIKQENSQHHHGGRNDKRLTNPVEVLAKPTPGIAAPPVEKDLVVSANSVIEALLDDTNSGLLIRSSALRVERKMIDAIVQSSLLFIIVIERYVVWICCCCCSLL